MPTESPHGDASPGVEAGENRLQEAVQQYIGGIQAGNTRANYEVQLEEWRRWLQQERGVERVDEIEVLDCRRYASHLKRRVQDKTIKASTARTYYATVRAFLSWCVAEERRSTNPAAVSRATDELPEDVGDVDRQFWTPEQREQLLAHVDERAHEALDEAEAGRRRAFRDRALAAVLALSGVRGAEVFREPRDDRRDGLRWRDVDLDGRTAHVLGKNREMQDVPLPEAVVEALDRHRQVQEPPTDEWPVFPSAHRPTLRAVLDEALGEAAANDALQDTTLVEAVREHEVVPPSITVDGARRIMQRLTDAAEIDVDDYLKPHGGRRGVGDTLYRSDPALAQLALRHGSLEVTHDAYQDIQAGEVAGQMDEVLGGTATDRD